VSGAGALQGDGAVMPSGKPPYDRDYEWHGSGGEGWLFFTMIVTCVVVALLWVFLRHGHAHGPAEWIQRGGYKNSAGELCCGERDCFELTDADVKITSQGYYIVSIKETVPFHEATPSPDGRYWRCQWDGSRKCFFAPPQGT
jgi:hypothetical protein